MSITENTSINEFDESLVEQLHSLYAEQALLQAELGTSVTEELVAIMSSFEQQLIHCYQDKEL
ncbi:MAG: hypothetical protein MK080_06295 [Opitutales bacterium]|nr:hypothetical protein [Opitutales bacterium]NRA27327.1 hypothetical protein [Opitutales bacterium]